ncbi:PLP-dependent aminotransferase family protein [Sphingomonas sp.]|uniref:aminotransferase-like domain-containing protein n=1 Tax=Sphingomonas sp. TaxID=28214 RepID=UPI002C573A18|nr:PLP-dependent aminotransferase family protein [Sphingomonas sp.]HWK35180.1 PLP-dependent aminotransferase family protein [Sphingomonas sp.]
MQNWTPDLSREDGPKYLAIAAALTRDIHGGALRPGDRLPPQRTLAERLSVDLTTVTKAYNEVRRSGLIEGGGRRGSFVRGAAADEASGDAAPPDTGMNLPPDPLGGTLADRYRRAVATVLTGPAAAARFHYQPGGGAVADREAGAAWLRAIGIEASADTVLLASGGQNALHAIVGAVLSPGDAVAVARHVYPGFLALARRYGIPLVTVAGDDEGIDPDALDAHCRAQAIRALYVVPTNDNPTAATMGAARRAALAEVARRHDLTIIEDDAYGRLPDAPTPPIAALAPERTWHVASLSKLISPGLRIAYLRAPSVRHAWRLATDLHETAVMAPPLNAAIASLWLRDGGIDALAGEVRAEAVARMALAREILSEVPFAAHPQGYHLWLPLPDGVAAGDVVNALRPAGLSVVPAAAFAVDPADATAALRVSIGGGLSRERLSRTLQLLDALLDQGGRRNGTAFV